MSTERAVVPAGYGELPGDLKERIRAAQIRAALSVNRELVLLYWRIGQAILQRQEAHGWGARVIDRLADDLRQAFPDMRGFSRRSLHYMRMVAEAYPEELFVQQAVAQIPWGHNVRLLDRVKDPAARRWYLRQTLAHGWSRDILVHQIDTQLYQRQGRAATRFKQAVAASETAREHQSNSRLSDTKV